MFDGRDEHAAERMVDEWQEGFENRAAQARELTARLSGLTASARSADELIEVTVGQAGELTGLRLDEDIRRHTMATIERGILATAAAARVALVRRVTAAVEQTIGVDSAAGQAVLAGYRNITPNAADR